MIEVEKKFVLTTDNLTKLTKGAKFVGEKSFTDSYYDTVDYALSLKDHWLRDRNSKWELKVPYNNNIPKGKRVSDQYKEIENEKEISTQLGFDLEKPLVESLEVNGYKPFATISTHRKKYSKDGFAIDVDSASYGYGIIEIELMVEKESEMEGATKKILEFARSLGLSEGVIRGKISEYLFRFNPADHAKLLAAGVLSK